ncbi:MAG: hypothetical protein ACE5I0_10115, partial [Candidatus Binatia bacterium]
MGKCCQSPQDTIKRRFNCILHTARNRNGGLVWTALKIWLVRKSSYAYGNHELLGKNRGGGQHKV